MKKVLLVATVQSHICQFHKPLMKLLCENGYEVHVAARNNLAEKNGLKMEYASKVFDIQFKRSPFHPGNLSAYKEFSKILKDNTYEIIHCNTPVGGIIARIAGNKYRKKGTKVFYTAHGFHFYNGAPKNNWMIYYPIEKFMAHFTDKLITITGEDTELAIKKFKCDVFHLHGVGASTSRFFPITTEEQEKQKEELGISGKIILNVGELLPNKNQKTAVKAMKKVLEKYPDATLLIAGNGSEKENLENLIKAEKLEENVKLLGYTREVNKYMQVCDFLVACSYREGLPLNLMEAMLCGKPVVASTNRGHRELVKEGVNGYLYTPDNDTELAEKICECLQSQRSIDEIINSVQPFTDTNVINELKLLYNLEN
ncbi:MAG: glycosyltransferase family 4 protein [Ruminococcaceae bacterium]|nr:glycosyltransferase family 4 protein [Oscillospiraceae bacterium]